MSGVHTTDPENHLLTSHILTTDQTFKTSQIKMNLFVVSIAFGFQYSLRVYFFKLYNSHKRQAQFGTTHHADHIRTCSGSFQACVISAVGVCRQRRGGPHTPGLRCSSGRADGDVAQGQSCGAWSRITAAEPVFEMKLSG